jgi:hypothetical protein
MLVPAYNILKIDSDYVFYVLCSESDCYLYQLEFIKNYETAFNSYKTPLTTEKAKIHIKNEQERFAKIFVGEGILSVPLFLNNSFFTPVTYVDKTNEEHVLFFSGGGHIQKGSCADIVRYDFTITELVNIQSKATSDASLQMRVLLDGPSFPISDYASILRKDNQNYFYIIHGGIGCDYNIKFSDLFSIDIINIQYKDFVQNYQTK